MSETEIIRKVIEKAIKNGWKVFGFYDYFNEHGEFRFNVDDYHGLHVSFLGTEGQGSNHYEINTIIFNHDFAKAFWPGNQYCTTSEGLSSCDPEEGCDCTDGPRHKLKPSFLYHLREMVVEENPLIYLEVYV